MDTECSICLEKLEGTIVILSCKHRYHGKCIEDWFNSRAVTSENICPECNIDAEIESIIDIPINNIIAKEDIINTSINNLQTKTQVITNNIDYCTYQVIRPSENAISTEITENRKNKCFKNCIIL